MLVLVKQYRQIGLTLVENLDVFMVKLTDFPQSALLTSGISCSANISSMKYQPVMRLVGVFLWNETGQLFFDRQRRFSIDSEAYSR